MNDSTHIVIENAFTRNECDALTDKVLDEYEGTRVKDNAMHYRKCNLIWLEFKKKPEWKILSEKIVSIVSEQNKNHFKLPMIYLPDGYQFTIYDKPGITMRGTLMFMKTKKLT